MIRAWHWQDKVEPDLEACQDAPLALQFYHPIAAHLNKVYMYMHLHNKR